MATGASLKLAFLLGSLAMAQTFEVASIRPAERLVGPDYNNQIRILPSGISASNATLRRLIADAYGIQLLQVIGPAWLDEKEYALEARAGGTIDRDALRTMLRALLTERFALKQHAETRDMRAYFLLAGPSGLKTTAAGEGMHFHGDLRQFADFLAVQLSIPIADDPTQPVRAGGPALPVLDKTGLSGTRDFTVNVRPELGTPPFSLWQRALRDQLGLRLESRRGPVNVIVVDDARQVPAAN